MAELVLGCGGAIHCSTDRTCHCHCTIVDSKQICVIIRHSLAFLVQAHFSLCLQSKPSIGEWKIGKFTKSGSTFWPLFVVAWCSVAAGKLQWARRFGSHGISSAQSWWPSLSSAMRAPTGGEQALLHRWRWLKSRMLFFFATISKLVSLWHVSSFLHSSCCCFQPIPASGCRVIASGYQRWLLSADTRWARLITMAAADG